MFRNIKNIFLLMLLSKISTLKLKLKRNTLNNLIQHTKIVCRNFKVRFCLADGFLQLFWIVLHYQLQGLVFFQYLFLFTFVVAVIVIALPSAIDVVLLAVVVLVSVLVFCLKPTCLFEISVRALV